jgi:hypothetical protein
MGRTNREREELKAQGYIYYKRLGKWMTIDEIERYERTEENVETVNYIIALIIAIGAFIFMFTYKP